MMVKPIRALELHYPMIQFLIKGIITCAMAMQICAPVKCRNQRILT